MVRVMSGKNVWILTEHGRVVNLLFKIIFERTFHNSGLLFQMLQLICSEIVRPKKLFSNCSVDGLLTHIV